MNASSSGMNIIGVVIGVVFMLVSVGWAIHTAWRTRGMPLTREDVLIEQLAKLSQQIKAQDQQIDMLLGQMLDRENRIRALELRTAELEREVERYRPTSAGKSSKAPAYSKAKKLSGEQCKALREEMIEAYPSREAWDTLLQDIDKRLDNVAIGDNLNVIAAKTLEQAQAGGWMVQLIREARNQRPGLPSFQTLCNALLQVLE